MVNLTFTTESEGIADAVIVDVKSKISFTSNLGNRIRLKIDGDTHSSEYYTGFMIYYPISVNPNTPTYYEYSYDYSDYGDRAEYCSSGVLSYDIIIDGVTVQSLANPLLNHNNKSYETDKFEIYITIIQKK